jgi:ribosomal protein L16 Arg81 hydroxylase
MTLDEALVLLRQAVKHSTSTDEFRHIDLSLVAAEKRDIMEQALRIAQKAMRDKVLSKEEFDRKVLAP